MCAIDFVGRGFAGGAGAIGCDAVQEAFAVFGVFRLKRLPAFFGEGAEARFVRF